MLASARETGLIRLFRNALLAPPNDRLVGRSFLNFVLSTCVSMALVAAILVGGKALGYFTVTPASSSFEISMLDFFGVVVFAPIMETLLLSAVLAALSQLGRSVPVTAIASACIWGGLHGLVAPLWFFGTVFGFFVFSCAYLTWEKRSYWYGFAAAALPHVMQNLLVFSMVGLLE